MKLSDYVINFIVEQGVSHIFEFTGGAIVHLLDSTWERQDIQCISVHHEQAGAFAAEAYARINGKLGVAMATSGPGALNMMTPIGSCYFDSVPCLFITGQVNTYEYKFDKPVRQIGFQETDIVSVAKPLTKYAEMVTDPETIKYHLEKAVWLAQSGRPGPVLLDLPMNIQRAQIDSDKLKGFFESDEFKTQFSEQAVDRSAVEQTIKLIQQSKRPIILAGGGVRASNAADELKTFVDNTRIPVVSSLMGLDVVPHDHPNFFGMIGSYGNRYANLAVANSDLVIVVGSRLDTRQTGTRPDTFARAAKKIQVDIDPDELGSKIKIDLPIHADVKAFLSEVNSQITEYSLPDWSAWIKVLSDYRNRYGSVHSDFKIDPNEFMEKLSANSIEGNIVTLDVGQHQMWAAQSFQLKKGQRMLASGGMGAMGFALPAAIGASQADVGKNCIVIAGDGGMQVNIHELDVIAHRQLPIKIFILNNSCLGMVRQFQDLYFEGRQQSTVVGYSCPDFVKIAQAYGITAFRITDASEIEELIQRALNQDGPVLVDVRLNQMTNVNPKLVVNRPIEDMSPHLDRQELQNIMLIDLAERIDVPK